MAWSSSASPFSSSSQNHQRMDMADNGSHRPALTRAVTEDSPIEAAEVTCQVQQNSARYVRGRGASSSSSSSSSASNRKPSSRSSSATDQGNRDVSRPCSIHELATTGHFFDENNDEDLHCNGGVCKHCGKKIIVCPTCNSLYLFATKDNRHAFRKKHITKCRNSHHSSSSSSSGTTNNTTGVASNDLAQNAVIPI